MANHSFPHVKFNLSHSGEMALVAGIWGIAARSSEVDHLKNFPRRRPREGVQVMVHDFGEST